MKKKYIVKENQEFSNIMKNGFKYQTELFSFYLLKNDYNCNKYGISISKKIGNAVIRNKLKRQIRSSIDNNKLKNISSNIIIIGRSKLKSAEYVDINNNIIEFSKMIGEKNEKKQ